MYYSIFTQAGFPAEICLEGISMAYKDPDCSSGQVSRGAMSNVGQIQPANNNFLAGQHHNSSLIGRMTSNPDQTVLLSQLAAYVPIYHYCLNKDICQPTPGNRPKLSVRGLHRTE
jgi:hypothetical protein